MTPDTLAFILRSMNNRLASTETPSRKAMIKSMRAIIAAVEGESGTDSTPVTLRLKLTDDADNKTRLDVYSKLRSKFSVTRRGSHFYDIESSIGELEKTQTLLDRIVKDEPNLFQGASVEVMVGER